ncbi:MAG: ABC transporter substrate-binding protein/permease [Deltaproteobacteria bacterium]|nr:ABC transporter substrate-binding protein/permease [Deltaproteobacteria bacterium]
MARFVSAILLAVFSAVFTAGCNGQETALSTLKDAEHARIGVMVGSTGEAVAKARFPEADLQSFDDVMDGIAAMSSGQLDAVVISEPTAIHLLKLNREFTIIPEPLTNEDTAIALKKGDPEMLAALNRIIAELKSDGTLSDMKRRWLKADLSPYEDKSPQASTEGPVFKVGVTATREPVSFVDKNGKVSGHDAELARIIAARLKRPVEFFNMKFMALIPALQSGKIDCIISGMTATGERRKSVDFSEPYFANKQVMIVKKPVGDKNAAGLLYSVNDLYDKRIAVILGTTHDKWATKTFPKATVLHFKTPFDMILALKSGKADAAVYTYDEVAIFLREAKELAVLGEPLWSSQAAIGFNKESVELLAAFNRFLKHIRENGQYDDMVKRWMEKGDTVMPVIPPASTDEVLTVGILGDNGLPFAIVKDGKLIGFNVELLDRFGAFIGKRIKYDDMEFGSIIAAAATKKIDMVGATIAITEERKKRIAFSDPYHELHSVAFALKKNIAQYQKPTPPEKKGAFSAFFKGLGESFHSNIILENRYLLIWDGLKTTMVISVFSTILGTLLGGLVCFMRMSKKRLLNLPAQVYISVLRGIPVLVLLMLIYYVVFASVNISPVLVSVIAFGLNFAAYVAEIFRSGIEGVDKGQAEAGIAMGFTRAGTFVTIILPQTVRRIIPVYKGDFITLVKMTSIVGYIAVQDLTKASDIIRSRTFDAFFPLVMVAVLYFSISWFLMLSLDYLDKRTNPRLRRRNGGAA